MPPRIRAPRPALALVSLLVVFVPGLGPQGVSEGPAQTGGLDTATIDRAIGRTGQLTGDVYRVTFPRTDLRVILDGVVIRTGLALTGWAAFRAAEGQVVTHGDLALAEREVNPVLAKLRAEDIEVTAIHNHLLRESPRVMYVHFWGRGSAERLASSLKAALALTATPRSEASPTVKEEDVPGAEEIQAALGLKGTVKGGVLGLSKPRPEPLAMMGVALPPAMGMATVLNFQSAGDGRVASTGDFVLTGDEVNPVITALRTQGIEVTALHNHVIHGTPELYFMHFWAHATPGRVAAGLKAGLEAMGERPPQPHK